MSRKRVAKCAQSGGFSRPRRAKAMPDGPDSSKIRALVARAPGRAAPRTAGPAMGDAAITGAGAGGQAGAGRDRLLVLHRLSAVMGKYNLRSSYWICANVLGVGLYLYFASGLWPRPEEVGIGDLAGNAIIFGFTVLPVLIAFMLINLLWLGLILLGLRRGNGWRPILVWMLVIASWIIVNRFDVYNTNHGSAFSRVNIPPASVLANPAGGHPRRAVTP